jgi:hypothetical protein
MQTIRERFPDLAPENVPKSFPWWECVSEPVSVLG